MSCRITDYDLVQAPTLDDLQAAVLARITQGWQPLGGIAATIANERTLFVQVVVIVVWETGKDTDTNGGKLARLPTRPKMGQGRG